MDGDVTSTETLSSLDRYVDEKQFRQLRLFFTLTGQTYSATELENQKQLLYFREILANQYKEQAFPILLYMLKHVGVQGGAQTLGMKIPNGILKRCKDEFAYPATLITVCSSLTDPEFSSLKGCICYNRILECSPNNIKYPEELIKRLHQKNSISTKSLRVLITGLQLCQRYDLAGILQKFTGELDSEQDPVPETSIQETDANRVTDHLSIHSKACSEMVVNTDGKALATLSFGNFSRGDDVIQDVPPAQSYSGSTPLTFVSQSSTGQLCDLDTPSTLTGTSEVSAEQESQNGRTAPTEPTFVPPFKGKDTDTQIDSNSRILKNLLQVMVLLCCRITKLLLVGATALVVLLFAISFIVWYTQSGSTTKEVLALTDDTVILAAEDLDLRHLLREYNVSVCKKSGDKSLYTNLYIATSSSLLELYHDHSLIKDGTSEVIHQDKASCKTGIVGASPYMYLLPNSKINYEICVKLFIIENIYNGELYIFDSETTFTEYLQSENCKGKDAVRSHNLILGSNDEFKCTTINFEAKKGGYYFIASRTPANIIYHYSYNITKKYLNPTELADRKCTLHNSSSCVFKAGTNTSLIAYVNPGGQEGSTHLCVEEKDFMTFFDTMLYLINNFFVLLKFFLSYLCSLI